MKFYIIAGEASGDLHGSNLISALRRLDPSASIRCWGGDLMEGQGAVLVKHYRELAFMGFAEVIRNLPAILRNLRFCREDINAFNPDVIVLIDYPGFNLRVAAWAKQRGYKVVYYISPQVWAWKAGRVKTIRRVVDKMLVILPFETEFYRRWDYKVVYVGHPLVDVIESFLAGNPPGFSFSRPVVAILPGSRRQEIAKKLPVMLEASRKFPEHQFVIAKAPSVDDSFYEQFLQYYPGVKTVANKTYQLLSGSVAALVTSGTATLETALFGVPQVVCYRGSAISFAIAKRLVKIRFISLVNLIMDRPVVKELIQDEMTVENIITELKKIIHDPDVIGRMKKDYTELHQLLRRDGDASSRAAREILDIISIG